MKNGFFFTRNKSRRSSSDEQLVGFFSNFTKNSDYLFLHLSGQFNFIKTILYSIR